MCGREVHVHRFCLIVRIEWVWWVSIRIRLLESGCGYSAAWFSPVVTGGLWVSSWRLSHWIIICHICGQRVRKKDTHSKYRLYACNGDGLYLYSTVMTHHDPHLSLAEGWWLPSASCWSPPLHQYQSPPCLCPCQCQTTSTAIPTDRGW